MATCSVQVCTAELPAAVARNAAPNSWSMRVTRACWASPRLFGYLEDRVRVNSGRPQLYGTQFLEDASGMRPRPIESPNRLAERRADVGMDPFEEYEATMHQIWARNNTPDAPAD